MLFKSITNYARKVFNNHKIQAQTGWEKENSTPTYPKLIGDIDEDINRIRQIVGDSSDIRFTTFNFGENSDIRGAVIFVDGLIEQELISQGILQPLKLFRGNDIVMPSTPCDIVEAVRNCVICSADVVYEESPSKLINAFMSGDSVVLINGFQRGLIVSTRGWAMRSVTEPQSESVVRGPRECFIENLRTNTALIRRRIKSQLTIEHMVIGRKSQTSVALAYVDGVVNPEILKDLKLQLQNISIDAIIDSSYIQSYIDHNPLCLFQTVNYTEKPDVACARILEGRIAIISDGSPLVLTVPMMFIESFQTAEDYYVRPIYATFLRLLRFISFFISIFAPSIYISLTAFHQELIPTELLFTLAEASEGTPFNAIIESLIMVLAFEILREAGLRLPRPVGQAISIVGALVMGEAAVSAGLVGAPIVITVAITAVAGFVVPSQTDAVTILRIISMIFAAFLGGYGFTLVFFAILINLASLTSFGVPYFEGLLPGRNLQDSYIRMPLWTMDKRPNSISGVDGIRQGNIQNKTNK